MQKVFVNGNSLTVTVPKVYAQLLNIKSGTEIGWQKTEKGLLLFVPQNSAKKATEIDPEVTKLIKKLSKKYSKVWQELASL
ncbi:MAG: hypothetical protein UU23_C0002G0003 [Candidatus Curtissbacteria bacterium GW2011_GWA1_40_9]|uniref:SpoVT-AbrB domain-containing protein n=1 Tax=Candidatus Curtissbacteria bacterium GW2011_GWA1_40_9 TaxID=1618408 RepID=A0A0G0TTP0_9BACT|nr:MAG: hypothetical protein UU23_C0002G0003 [Candidatus Curtissbacteria bacterium GW2011_GWA1_40_9]